MPICISFDHKTVTATLQHWSSSLFWWTVFHITVFSKLQTWPHAQMSDYNRVLCVTPKANGWSLWMLFYARGTCDPTIGWILRASVMICNRKVLYSGTCRPSGLHATGSLSHTVAMKHRQQWASSESTSLRAAQTQDTATSLVTMGSEPWWQWIVWSQSIS